MVEGKRGEGHRSVKTDQRKVEWVCPWLWVGSTGAMSWGKHLTGYRTLSTHSAQPKAEVVVRRGLLSFYTQTSRRFRKRPS